MPRLLERPPAQALQGRDSWSPLTHFPYLRVTHFCSIKGLEPVLGWKLALLVVGNCAVFPLRERSGEGSMAPQAGVQAVSPSPDGSVSLATVPKCEQAGRNTSPWGSGTSGQRVHVCQPCVSCLCLALGTRGVGCRCGLGVAAESALCTELGVTAK